MHYFLMTASQRSDHSDPPAFPEVLAAARAGDQDALSGLFRQFYPAVERQVHGSLARDLRVNRPWLSTRFSTGDVVQEVFRSVLSDLHGFSGGTEELFTHYLTTVVRNRLLDVVRFHEAERRDGRRTRMQPEDDNTPSPHDGPATDAVLAEQRALLDEVLRTFDDREQELLRRRIEGEEEFQELHSSLGYSSLSACRRAFYAANAKLAIRLRQRQSDQTR
ncbi:MAG: RNA polymerase sigma factor [Planctomycetota bacterium]